MGPSQEGWSSWGIYRAGTNSISQVDGVSDPAPAYQLVDSLVGGFKEETMAHLSVWEKAVYQLFS